MSNTVSRCLTVLLYIFVVGGHAMEDKDQLLVDVNIKAQSNFYSKNGLNFLSLKITNKSNRDIFLDKGAIGIGKQTPNFLQFTATTKHGDPVRAPYKGKELQEEKINESRFQFIAGDIIYLLILLDDWYQFERNHCYNAMYTFVGTSVDQLEVYTSYIDLGEFCPKAD